MHTAYTTTSAEVSMNNHPSRNGKKKEASFLPWTDLKDGKERKSFSCNGRGGRKARQAISHREIIKGKGRATYWKKNKGQKEDISSGFLITKEKGRR